MRTDILDLVMQLHQIARQVEPIEQLESIGHEIRNIADKLNRVYTNHVAAGNLSPLEREYADYLAHLGE